MSINQNKKTDCNSKKNFVTVFAENKSDMKEMKDNVSEIKEPKSDLITEHESGEKVVSRRKLIKKGWVVPVILSVQIPMGKLFAKHGSPGGSGSHSSSGSS